MKRKVMSMLLALGLLLSMVPSGTVFAAIDASIFSGGSGTESSPYEINTLSQLEAFRDSVNNGNEYGGVYLKLTSSIDMSSTYGEGKKSWTPIGRDGASFQGKFNGNSKEISNLYIDSTEEHVGLFGSISHATIESLSVSGVVKGTKFVGGIAGSISSSSTVTLCSSLCDVSGTRAYVGGIVGYNEVGTVSRCYNAGSVAGGEYAGGIVGNNRDTVENCYNVGPVRGAGSDVGGICGYSADILTKCYSMGQVNGSGIAGGIRNNPSNCYYLSGTATTGGVKGKDVSGSAEKISVAQLASEDTFSGWDFSSVWAMNSYASLERWIPSIDIFITRPQLKNKYESYIYSGRENQPYIIASLESLEKLRDKVNNGTNYQGTHFWLTEDIDMSSVYGEGKKSWTPIGTYKNSFKGSFDGDKHKISGLYININDSSLYLGLFGVSGGGYIKNLSASGTIISSSCSAAGGIVGSMGGGTIENCSFSGSITGDSMLGGIAGQSNSNIINCKNEATVSTNGDGQFIGGIVGGTTSATSHTLEKCVNTGNILPDLTATNAGAYVGGIMGFVGKGRFINCYNTGSVTAGAEKAGGIVGYFSESGVIENCYNTGKIKMNRDNTLYGGLIGDHGSSFKAENIKNSYYLDTASSGGDYDDGSYGTPKNAEAFSQGEIAYKLQAGQTVSTPRVWGQTIGTDPTPIFGGSTLYQVTFMVNNEEYATRYANYDKCVTLPANPTKENYRFYYWSKTNSPSNDRLTSTTSVRSNMTVYAVAQGVTVSSGKGDVIIENRRKALNINLYDYVQNASGTDKRFTFRLQRGALPSGLTLENGIISGTTEQTGVFSLEFYIINDEVQLMGLDSSGTTLKLKLIIGLDGEGTAESPYLINNSEDFKLFCDIVNSGETYLRKEIELRTDIDLGCNKDNLWEPLGVRVWDDRNYMNVGGFGGIFNGNGHTISGLYTKSSFYSGLFDYVYRGSIKNLTVSGTVEGNYTVGGIAAEGNYANFSGCVNLCTVNGIGTVGGIVGTSHEGSISDCINAGAVTGTHYDIGGISGDCLSAVTNCRNVGTVKGTDETCSRVGGIAGMTRREVKNCYNTGSVSGKEKVGGISGHCDQYNIQFCFNKGSISGTDGVGGIAGYTGEESIMNCYNTGSVSGNTNVGGVNGYTEGNTSYCYSVGTISGSESNIGGVVGYTKGNVTACYYLDGCNSDGTQLDAPYGTALSAADIKKIESFSDWDFEGKWTLNSGRPMLKDNAEMRDFAVKSVSTVDGTMSAELFIPFAGTYHVAFAAYEGNKLKDNAMKTLTVNATDQGFKTVTPESEITLGVGDKVMLLSDIIAPMCGAYVITEE